MATPLKRKAAGIATSASKKPKANASITSFFGAPKQPASSPISKNPSATDQDQASSQSKSSPPPSSAPLRPPSSISTVTAFSTLGAPAPAQKFDKKAWVDKLSQEQKDLLALEIHSMHETWLAVLKDEIVTKEFLELKRFLKKEREAGKTIFPPAEDVYSWSGCLLCVVTSCPKILQVPAYSPSHRQGGDPGARPLSQHQSSSRPLLLCARTNTCSSVSEEHIHCPQERLPCLQSPSQERRTAHPVG